MSFKFFKKLLAISCIFTMAMPSGVFASNLAKVTADNVNLRSYNSTAGHVVGSATKDETLTIVSNANNGWFQIKKSNGSTGFISADFIQITQTDATCIAESVNVRTAPSTSSTILGTAKKGQVFVTSGCADGWYAIKFNNTTGYIYGQYMQGTLLSYLPKINATAATANTATTAKAAPAGSNMYAVVDASSLNLRKGPNTDGQPIKALPEGYNLTVLSSENGWIKVVDDTGTTGYVSANHVTLKNGTKPANKVATTTQSVPVSNPNNTTGAKIVEFGEKYIGTPYVWGGTDLTSGVDCSGFVYSCYKEFGINLLRTSRDMYTQGTTVERDSLQAGDLVFFNSGGDSEISHVGMYIGDDKYIHSTNGSGNGVTISDLTSSYSVKTYVGAKRVL